MLALTDESGLPTDRLNFDAWGVPKVGTDFGTSGNRFAFTSHRFDTELDLYYAGGRMYSPTIGRFISQDTLSLDPNNPDTWNLFNYGRSNPTRYVDPTGHQTRAANATESVDPWDVPLTPTASQAQEPPGLFARFKTAVKGWVGITEDGPVAVVIQPKRRKPKPQSTASQTMSPLDTMRSSPARNRHSRPPPSSAASGRP